MTDLSDFVTYEGIKFVPLQPETGQRINAGYIGNKGSALDAVRRYIETNYKVCSSCRRYMTEDDTKQVFGNKNARICSDCHSEEH